jgi:hypothetical protein
MKNWVFFLISFGIASLIYGLLSISRFFWRDKNPLDLNLAQMSIISGTAKPKEKLLIFLVQFLGCIFHPWIYIVSLIATIIFSLIK